MKKLSSLFLLFLGVLTLNQSCQSKTNSYLNNKTQVEPDQACIDHVLLVDSQLGKIRNEMCEKLSLSFTIDYYTQKLESLPFEDCPITFKEAFLNHIEAWKKAKSVTDDYPKLRGEMHVLFDKIYLTPDSTTFKKLVDDIWSTWSEVENTSKVSVKTEDINP
ncbi:MAG: hypothetical protein HKO66_07855 [Saprospiraceae bacterium]|nr:hypothetical protein [Bacteroidia bacterium]NNE14290.1 hypothetical protein [Saprospiraceae bacterium]NNL92130.1 hypothetical protein [Saprospiraceae bacterium]